MASKKGDLSATEKKLFEFINNGAINDAKNVLKEKDVRVDCLDESGMTPLQQAAYRGNRTLCELLLSSGADVNSNYHDSGYTALMFAALSGSTNVTRLMLEAGAMVDVTNSVGRNAAQMAAFVGQHECVSLINNFFSRDDLEYYTKPQGLETEPKLPAHLSATVYKLILNNNMKTVKTCLFLQEHSELLEHGEKLYKFFETLCERMMKQKQTNEVMAMKFHYYGCAVKKCFSVKDTLDTWIKALLRMNDEGFEMEQEKFIRSTYRDFPYMENQLIQQMVRQLAPVKLGDSPTAFDVLDQAINGQHMPSETEKHCATCRDIGAEKKCSACKYVFYCNQNCQKLQWFTHKKQCKKLAEIQKKVEEDKKLLEEQEKLDELRLKAEAEAKKTMENETSSKESESKSMESEILANSGARPKENGTSPKVGSSGDDADPPTEDVPELLRRGYEYLSKKENQKAINTFQKAMELDSSCKDAIEGYRKAFMNDLADPDEIKRRADNSPEVQRILSIPGMRDKLKEMQEDPEALKKYLQEDKTAKEVEKLLQCALIDE